MGQVSTEWNRLESRNLFDWFSIRVHIQRKIFEFSRQKYFWICSTLINYSPLIKLKQIFRYFKIEIWILYSNQIFYFCKIEYFCAKIQIRVFIKVEFLTWKVKYNILFFSWQIPGVKLTYVPTTNYFPSNIDFSPKVLHKNSFDIPKPQPSYN